MRFLFTFCLILSVTLTAQACSFFTRAEFCPLAESLEDRRGVGQSVVHLIGEEVIQERRPDGTYFAPVFRVRVIEALEGRFRAGDVFHLWTGDDWNCNGPVDYIEPGREYIIGFPDSLTDQRIVTELMPDAPEDLYNLWGWGALVYRLNNFSTPPSVETQEYGRVTIEKLRNHIDDCHPDIRDLTISVYPNPTDGWVSVHSPGNTSLGIRIFDQAGRYVGSYKQETLVGERLNFSIDELPAGVYHLIVETEFGNYSRRVIRK